MIFVFRSVFGFLLLLVAAAAPVIAQDITPQDLCEAGIGEVFGGIGRLGCKAVRNEDITANDVVDVFDSGRWSPTSRASTPYISDPYPASPRYPAQSAPPYPSQTAAEVRHPCDVQPNGLDCEYQRILDDLEAEYGPLTGTGQW